MMIWTQSALLNPDGGMVVDSADFVNHPRAPLPDGALAVGHSRGWIQKMSIQGVGFSADHYAIEQVDTEIVRVITWNDDPVDYPAGKRFAQAWTFLPLAPDPKHGGAWNTRQSQIIYLDLGSEMHKAWTSSGPIQNTEFRDWSEFVFPDESIVRHGIWLPNELNEHHDKQFKQRGWREWTDGVPADQIDASGKVRQQRPQGRFRKPLGTITYYQRDTNLLGVHTPLSDTDDENELSTTEGSGETEASTTLSGGESDLLFCFTTLGNNPNVADWPSGDYQFQLDVASADSSIEYGARTAGTVSGHIARVDGGLTADLDTWPMTENLFTGPGLKFGSTGTIDPISRNITDRYEILIGGYRTPNHGNQAVTLTFDADAYANGPWEAAIGPQTGHFMGFNF